MLINKNLFKLYQQAADLGDMYAQYNLGAIYEIEDTNKAICLRIV